MWLLVSLVQEEAVPSRSAAEVYYPMDVIGCVS